MADNVMALLNEDDEMILALEAQLKKIRDSIDNIMKATEMIFLDKSLYPCYTIGGILPEYRQFLNQGGNP